MTTRNVILLSVLGVVVVVAAWWFLLYKPALDDQADLRAQIDTVQAQQVELQTQIDRRKEVRANIPEIEARLAAYRSVIPASSGLPALLRQLQTAADDSGLALLSVSPGEVSVIEGVDGVSQLTIGLQLEGGYFQVVDFLRRLEDPNVTARALLLDQIGLAVSAESYPVLTMTASGRVFTSALADDAVLVPVPTEGATPTDGATPTAEVTP